MKNSYLTTRLKLNGLSLNDEQFIMELVNTPEWIKFIGDKKIRTKEEARIYIQKIIDNLTVNYWIVKLQEQNIPIGIISFMKRDYLEHYDIGFALLSKFANKGYAYEATTTVLNDVINDHTHTQILAITVKENTNSIKLLCKLGFRFEKKIKNEHDLLLVYSLSGSNQIKNNCLDK